MTPSPKKCSCPPNIFFGPRVLTLAPPCIYKRSDN